MRWNAIDSGWCITASNRQSQSPGYEIPDRYCSQKEKCSYMYG